MPEPISAAFLPPDFTCHGEADPPAGLGREDQAAAPLGGPSGNEPSSFRSNTSHSAVPATAASELAASYLQKDYSKLLSRDTGLPSVQAFFATTHGPGYQFQPELGASRTTLRGSVDGVHLTATLDMGTAGMHVGIANDDGSEGANAGVGATAIGLEVTAEYDGWSFTFGEALSVGGGFSSGAQRDIDGDGVPERCFKGSLGSLTVGFCDEL